MDDTASDRWVASSLAYLTQTAGPPPWTDATADSERTRTMGHREVRPVPLDWQHPQEGGTYADGSPRYRPLFSRADLRYKVKFYAENPQYADEWEYDPADFMPEIPEGTPLGYQLYETTTEGTPVSPVFATLEDLAAWCEDGATVFADHKWTREQWLASFEAESLDTDSLLAVTPDGTGPLGDV